MNGLGPDEGLAREQDRVEHAARGLAEVVGTLALVLVVERVPADTPE